MTGAEERAFIEGYHAGSEAQVQAHDRLLTIVADLMVACRVFVWRDGTDVAERMAALREYDDGVLAVVADVKTVRFNPQTAVERFAYLRQIERAVEAAEGVER